MSKDKRIIKGMIGDLYDNDVWVRGFMDECFLMWGFPCSTLQCMSKQDRTMFAWGMLHLVQSLTKDKDIWWGMRDKVEPRKAAWEYSRRVFESTGLDLIPPLPAEIPDERGTLALTTTNPLVRVVDTPVSGSSSI